MTKNHDTPRTDACPHCGAEWELPEKMFTCGTHVSSGRISESSELCEERSARQKLESEVDRLRSQRNRAVEIAEKIWTDCSNGHEHTELSALKGGIK